MSHPLYITTTGSVPLYLVTYVELHFAIVSAFIAPIRHKHAQDQNIVCLDPAGCHFFKRVGCKIKGG